MPRRRSFSTWPRSRWCAKATPVRARRSRSTSWARSTCWKRSGALGTALRGGRGHQRQVLREPRTGLGLSRDRRPGRPRSLQRQQGGGGNRRGLLSPLVLPARAARGTRRETGDRPGGQRHRRRRLGQGSHRRRPGSPSCRPASPCPCAIPRAVRPWQHVLEPLGGYLALAARMLESDDPAWCDAWNFGPLPGDEIPVCRLVELFIAAWGGGAWEDVSDPRPAARGARAAAVHRQGHAPARLAAALGRGRGRRRRGRLVSAVLRSARLPACSRPAAHDIDSYERPPHTWMPAMTPLPFSALTEQHVLSHTAGLVGAAARPAAIHHRRDGLFSACGCCRASLGPTSSSAWARRRSFCRAIWEAFRQKGRPAWPTSRRSPAMRATCESFRVSGAGSFLTSFTRPPSRSDSSCRRIELSLPSSATSRHTPSSGICPSVRRQRILANQFRGGLWPAARRVDARPGGVSGQVRTRRIAKSAMGRQADFRVPLTHSIRRQLWNRSDNRAGVSPLSDRTCRWTQFCGRQFPARWLDGGADRHSRRRHALSLLPLRRRFGGLVMDDTVPRQLVPAV